MSDGAAPKPKKTRANARVRMYRVGFGDFFLISVQGPRGESHVLVDCGVHAGDLHTIEEAVADMAKVTGSRLSLVVATHRHADHISGFATCAHLFRQFTVDAVWMSWWDDPDHKEAAAFQVNLAGLAARLQLRLTPHAKADPVAEQFRMMALNITGGPLTGADADPKFNGKNDAALAMLRGTPVSSTFCFRNKPRRSYLKAGDTPELPPELVEAGLSARVLGPPSDRVTVAKMDNSARQYFGALGQDAGPRRDKPFSDDWEMQGDPFDGADGNDRERYPIRALQPFKTRADLEKAVTDVAAPADVLLSAAKKADNTVNNQSLVVHFTLRRKGLKAKTLLFVGDAQWGNWSNFLFGRALSGKEAAPLLPDAAALMKNLDFYKVGHHGSTNSTPIDALEALGTHCVAMCSTQGGCYPGTEGNHSEVPRTLLIERLVAKTRKRLVRSDDVAAGSAGRADPARPPLPKTLSSGSTSGFTSPGALYIDYTL